MDNLNLPDGFTLLENQVAGHVFQSDANTLGLLQQANTGCVLKPFGKKECGEREYDFYQEVLKANDSDVSKNESESILTCVCSLIPRFYEKIELSVNNRKHIFLKLEDLTYGMKQPCIMDIKIGKRTWDPNASEEKRLVEEQKYTKCKNVLGLCLPGFQMYSKDDKNRIHLNRHSKNYGKQLDANGFCSTIAMFLNTQEYICKPLILEIYRKLQSMLSWFDKQNYYHFYASSILIAYDYQIFQNYKKKSMEFINDDYISTNGYKPTQCYHYIRQNITESDDKTLQDWIKVKMIDFAHVFPSEDNSLDENYMFGLKNLISIIEDLLYRR